MLGLKKGNVEIVPHKEQWHRIFAEEEALLRAAIGEFVLRIEHIGSTAVCGIAAKPVLDIGAAVKDKSSGEKRIAPLQNIGCEYRGENGIIGRFYFVKGAASQRRTHHLRILLSGSREWRDHLFFSRLFAERPRGGERVR